MESRKVYLLSYNAVQLYLWSQVLFRMAIAFSYLWDETQEFEPTPLFDACISFARRAQTLAWLEVLHTAVGLAGGGVAAAIIQCLGRYVILIFVVIPIDFMHSSWVSVVMIFVWAAADVVRYAFYLRALVGDQWAMLLWLRYSLFVVLYPIGIVSEWLVYKSTLSYVDKTELYAVKMPNSWNFAFTFGIWNRIVLLLYFYFGPFMFLHMLRQRRTKLGPS